MAKTPDAVAICIICGGSAKATEDGATDSFYYACDRCGNFGLTRSAHSVLKLKKLSPRQTANASGWIRENQGVRFNTDNLDNLLALRTPSVGERSAKVLLELEKRSLNLGTKFQFNFGDPGIADWVAISWSTGQEEVRYIFTDVLLRHGLIDGNESKTVGGPGFIGQVAISPTGYEQLEKWRTTKSAGSIGFCAMWFDNRLLPLWTDGIEPAIAAAGYKPERIDRIEHNNKIDDEIVATIRKSRFVVADFTGNRGGVYFEAGFALGLNIPVIWTIRAGRFHRLHFDNRQYNFVDWKHNEFKDFQTRLRYRIEATIGRGPLSPATKE